MYGMRVIKPTTIKSYAKAFPDAAEALMAWLDKAEIAEWQSIIDVRKVFPHADATTADSGNILTIFNIRGNRYRLITAIKYRWAMVYVLGFLTHADYDKEKWKAQL